MTKPHNSMPELFTKDTKYCINDIDFSHKKEIATSNYNFFRP